ncbi:hypothetical protein PFICI_13678 [Pestalotiopsis fici W106-1]|uniref:SprT-like domain-containing protein n=1 Tax=Pestalotiopsis fici (strain W106-1 / CGMCC3.15140) TaxID=1229662 RepID=W3WN33_PESFW|nr:uncharacterized protein PFICI_13678 [Pestalotiopsis fici W106-1]ETS75194.1 hypothetical protein PFICI_13678 [Pestalotiopsis fici W106-1]
MSQSHICTKKHYRPPGYVRGGDQRRPALVFQGYKARPLLNCTVGSFWEVPTNELAQAQIKAKTRYQELFGKYSKMTRQQLHKQDLPKMLTKFAHQLDEFFFFGSLFNSSGIRVHVQLLPEHREHLCLGRAFSDEANDMERFVQIARRTRVPVGRAKLSLVDMLGVLYHELLHTYLGLYLCQSDGCEWYRLNAEGLSGHGPVFRALEHTGLKTLQSWGTQKGETVIPPEWHDDFVWTASWQEECQEVTSCKELGKIPHAHLANLRHNPSPNEIIQVRGIKVIIDGPRLRRHVKKNAKKDRKHQRKQT